MPVTCPRATATDLVVEQRFSLVHLTGMTDRGRRWLRRHCQAEAWQWLGEALTIDHRLAEAIVRHLLDDHLTVEDRR